MKARKLTKQEAFDLVFNVPAFATYDYHELKPQLQ